MTIAVSDLHRILALKTEPARRHKCCLCLEIFECHICMIEEDNYLHMARTEGQNHLRFICEPCIHKHEMYVAEVLHGNEEPKGISYYRELGVSYNFYDQITGLLLGKGTIRRS